ncbi:MAG: hypothetical protein JNJ77_10025 [Planctomycetia bacterium]|nr:hypothetical protein [Planctomycetia bacterium]
MSHLAMIAGVLLSLFSGACAFAQTVVVPPSRANSEGNTGLQYTTTGGSIFQQLYGSSLLSGFPIGSQITAMQVRLNGGDPSGPSEVLSTPNFDIYLGPSNFTVGSLSSSVAANQGPGTVQVRNGPLSFGINSYPGGATPNAFGPVINFSTPYIYTGGDLLMTITWSHAQAFTFIRWDFDNAIVGAQYRENGFYNDPVVPNNVTNGALIVQFQYAAVPEPTTLAFTGCAKLVAGAWYYRRRQNRLAILDQLSE